MAGVGRTTKVSISSPPAQCVNQAVPQAAHGPLQPSLELPRDRESTAPEPHQLLSERYEQRDSKDLWALVTHALSL